MAVVERRTVPRGTVDKERLANASGMTYAVQISDYFITNQEKLEQTVSEHPFFRGVLISFAVCVLLGSIWLMVELKKKLWR